MDKREKIKALMISTYPVLPADAGGKIRTTELARNLCHLGVDITILTPYHIAMPSKTPENEIFNLQTVKYPFVLPFLLSEKPFPFWYLVSFHPGLRLFLRDLGSFDIIQFESPEFVALLKSIPANKPIIYDAHNVQYDYVRSECHSPLIRRIAEKRIFKLESTLLNRSRYVFTCSNRDKDRFSALYKIEPRKLALISHGIKKISKIDNRTREKRLINIFPDLINFSKQAIFSGNDVNHNRFAADFIVNKLAPQLKTIGFIIHGPCGKRFRHLRKPNIFFDIEYEGFEKYTCPGTVALNPMTRGAGSNLKVLHYLAHHVPVISTEFGMRGYEDLKEFVTQSSLEHFAEALQRPQTLPNGIDKVLRKYLWSTIAQKVKGFYESILR